MALRADCGAIPFTAKKHQLRRFPCGLGPVAQWLEPAAHNGLVAGSSPAGPTVFSNGLCRSSLPCSPTGQWFDQCLTSFSPEPNATSSILKVIWVIVPVHPIKYLDAHSEEPRSLPLVGPTLHQPCCGSMAQRVWRNAPRQSRKPNCRLKPRLDRFQRFAVPLHEVVLRDAKTHPPAHVWK